tara:strand:- start:63 stop:449 length:387 start_codon:yes stop_codon:yes gene_type:complete
MYNFNIVHTTDAPEAIGPYSQAVVVGEWVFASGQIPIQPSTGEVIEGDVSVQTDQVLSNLKAVLESAGSSLDKVVKTTVYLTDLDTFTDMNAVYAEYFGDHRPARATVEVAGLPKDVGVEIDVIALKD